MEWIESVNPELVIVALVVAVGSLATAAIGFARWTSGVEHSRVRRYVEARGGTVLSIRRTNRFTQDIYVGELSDWRPTWQLDPTTPRFRVRWRDRSGREHEDTFVTEFFRRSVWTAEPLADGPELPADVAALAEENRHLRAEIARRRAARRREPDDQAGDAPSDNRGDP